MRVVLPLVLAFSIFFPARAPAQSNTFRFAVPEALVATGFTKFLFPRFSLKTGTRIVIVGEGEPAELRLNAAGRGQAVFEGLGQVWSLERGAGPGAENAAKFLKWLAGGVGQRTITAFKIDGTQAFKPLKAKAARKKVALATGDIVAGEKLAERHCGRCHMVNEKTRMTTIGSSPSFALLRSFNDWSNRFEAFYALNPHPAFTMIEGVTAPFDKMRPPPIAPLELTSGDIDAILAYVRTIEPADLGAPIQLQ